MSIGIFPSVPTSVTWYVCTHHIYTPHAPYALIFYIIHPHTIYINRLNNNLAGDVKRATGSAMMIAFGTVGGVIASQLYQSSNSPEYTIGHSIAAGFLFVTICLVLLQYKLLKTENELKIGNPDAILAGKSDSEISNLGDLHPSFIYTL